MKKYTFYTSLGTRAEVELKRVPLDATSEEVDRAIKSTTEELFVFLRTAVPDEVFNQLRDMIYKEYREYK